MGTTALIALTAASAASAVAQGAISIVRAKQAESAAERQQSILIRRGQDEADLRRQEARRLLGRQRSLAGASGLDSTSFFDLFADTAIREEAAAHRVAQRFAHAGADAARQGRLAASNLSQQGATTILGGITSFAAGTSSILTQQSMLDSNLVGSGSRFGPSGQSFGGML